jgi:CBS-domain-containing membrane protein
MIGGGAISSLLAVAFQKAFASTSLTWLAGALSVATAISAMAITGTISPCSDNDRALSRLTACPIASGTMNPPGGALALLYIATPSLHVLGWWYIGVAIMNALILILVGILVNNIPRAMQYPTYWL